MRRINMECEFCTISVRGVAPIASLAPSSFHFSCSGQHPLQLLKGAFTSAAHSSIPFSCSPAVSSTRMLSFSEKCVLGVPGLKFPHVGLSSQRHREYIMSVHISIRRTDVQLCGHASALWGRLRPASLWALRDRGAQHHAFGCVCYVVAYYDVCRTGSQPCFETIVKHLMMMMMVVMMTTTMAMTIAMMCKTA